MIWLAKLFWLLVAHALCDYSLQSSDMLRHKDNRYVSDKKHGPWWWTMTAHSFINGGGVALATGSWGIGVLETIVHF